MRKAYENIKKDMNDLKDICKDAMVTEILEMDSESLKAMHIMLRMVKHSEELMDAYVDHMETQNEKLNMILDRLEAK